MDLRIDPTQAREGAVEHQPSAHQLATAEFVEEPKKNDANSCITNGIAVVETVPNTSPPTSFQKNADSCAGIVGAVETQPSHEASTVVQEVIAHMMDGIGTNTKSSDGVSQLIGQKEDEIRVALNASMDTDSPLCNNADSSMDISIPDNAIESSSMQPPKEEEDLNLASASTQDDVLGEVSDEEMESSESDSDVNETDLSGVIDKKRLDEFMAEESSNFSDVLRTANEQDASKLPIADRMSMLIPETASLPLAGSILSIVEGTVVIMCSPGALAVDIGSAFALSDRIPLGWVDEVFGPVDAPLYTVRIADDHGISPEHLAPGKSVFYVEELSNVVKPSLLDSKGTDASGLHDEPVLHQVDFSDDEEERLYKRSQKKQCSRASSRASSQSDSAGHRGRRSPSGRGRGRGRGRGHHHQQERGRDHTERQRHEYRQDFGPERQAQHFLNDQVPLREFQQMAPFPTEEHYEQRQMQQQQQPGAAPMYYMHPSPQMMYDARRFQYAGRDQWPPQFDEGSRQ